MRNPRVRTRTSSFACFAIFFAALFLAAGAHAKPRVTPVGDGTVSVALDGCTVVFDAKGDVLSRGGGCKDKQVRKAKNQFAAYEKENKGKSAASQHKKGDKAAAAKKGDGPDEWMVRNVRGNAFGLQAKPSEKAPYVARGIRNGARMQNLGCGQHEGATWCQVEYGKNTGWVQRRYLADIGG